MKNVILLSSFVSLLAASLSQSAPWPSWRGDIAGAGRTEETGIPMEWGPEKNVKWRIELPERGNSTPVVWGDKVFVSQAVDADHWRGVLCFDRKDGSLLWKEGVNYDTPERSHRDNPYCSASPAVNGEVVVVSYGSAGVAAYDLEGERLWFRDLGPIDHVWGNSTSPVIVDDLVIHYHGPGEGAFLSALRLEDGETVWTWEEPRWDVEGRTDGFRGREGPGVVGSFSTPIVIDGDGRSELVMSFPKELKAFDLETGDVLWTCAGLNPLVYTSPMVSGDRVVVLGGYHGNSIGVKAGGEGDVTDSHRLWQRVRHNGGIGTGVVRDGHYYYQTSGGVANCIDVETGELLWEARLPGAGKSWGSFVLSGDRIYTLSQAGDSVVFRADPEGFEVLARNDLGEHTNSSIAVSDGEIFIRTHEALWCIAEGE